MKHYFTFLLIFASITACTTDNETFISENNNDLKRIQNTYESYRANFFDKIDQSALFTALEEPSRSNISPQNGDEYVEFIASIPPEKVDSLYNIYCTMAAEEEYNYNYDIITEALIENSSIEEVQALYNFTDKYIECGGHNMDLLIQETQPVSPIIEDCMIRSAATIDEFIPDNSDYRLANAHCIRDLYQKLIESYVDEAVAESVGVALAGIPGIDVAYQLVCAGVGLYESIKLAHEYNICCTTSVS